MSDFRSGALVAALFSTILAQQARAEIPSVPEDSNASRARALTCLTQAIAYEAGYEPMIGQQAVAEVILNRTHSPVYPTSVCGVVYQGALRSTGCQFTFTCDGSLRRRLPDRVLARAREVAAAALDNQMPQLVAGAMNYHADYVSPYWAPTMERVAKIGRHIFYRPSVNGLPVSLATGYAGGPEPEVAMAGANAYSATGRMSLAGDPARPREFSLWGLRLERVARP